MRDRGTFNFSGNLEVKKDAPLEARSLVNSYADLVKPETWTDEQGGIWKYDCMLVSCKDRPGKVYQLSPGADYTKESSWILIGDTSELNNKVQEFIDSKGAPNGLASLNESGIIPSAQLPSYVDDVIEVDTFSNLPGTGESGKIYIVQDTNLTYRWSGTAYVEISKSLALGETSSTAYPGDKGKATTDKLNKTSDKVVVGPTTVNPSTDKIVIKYQTHFTSTNSDSEDSHTINAATTSQAGLMSSSDKTKLDGLKDQAGITSDIDAVQTNLETHINNKSNPHEVNKAQVGLGNVDNTSDANKPISTATQNALNSKFNASDGNALKQTIESMPNLVVTEGRLSHKNDRISLSLIQQDLKDQANNDSISLTFNPATDSTAGIILPSDKTKIDKIITNGNGTKYLSDNGTYKEVSGEGESNISAYVLDKNRDNRKSVSLVGEGFDENHWYPVSFTADPNSIVPPCNLIIWNSLNNDSSGISPKPSWATNDGGFTLHVDMSIIGSGWGQYANAKNKLNNYDGEWGGETAVGEMFQTTQTSTFYIYLRGGANYFYTSDYADLKMTAHSSEVLDGYNTYSIKDTQGDIKDFFNYVENDLFDEVKNLQIVHNNEFNFANNSIGEYVWINYRSRYNAVTSAKAVYIGNGQAGADGAYGAVHASGFFKESDIRLKSDIAPLKHTLDQICNIPTVEFNMHDKHQIGTIAQDLENNFAEVVNTDSDGMKSVDYCMLGVVAIEGIKLLKQEVEDLKKQIEELKNGKQGYSN